MKWRVERLGNDTELRSMRKNPAARSPADDMVGDLMAKDRQRRLQTVLVEKVAGNADRPRRPVGTGAASEPGR